MRKITSACNNLSLRLKYNYTPVSNYQIKNKPNPIISVTFGSDKETLFNLQFRLFENVLPRTTQNFKRLLLGTASYQGRALSLIGNNFHNVLPRAYAQLGHLKDGNCSIYGSSFRDQSFELPHDRPGLLSCVSQENTNNSRFLITLAPTPFLDLRNVVFGEVTAETIHNLKVLQKLTNFQNYHILSTQLIQTKQQHHDAHHH